MGKDHSKKANLWMPGDKPVWNTLIMRYLYNVAWHIIVHNSHPLHWRAMKVKGPHTFLKIPHLMATLGLIIPSLKCALSVITCFLPHSHTCLEIEMASASSTLNTLEVKPSPRSLASQHLQAKIYLTPLVGTATDSSSTSQQLSGVAPSWPSCREAEKQSLRATWVYFSASPCVYVNVTETLKAWCTPPISLPHLDLFDLPHVWTVGLEALQRASLKALHPVRQVQPQPLCLGVIGPDDDHKSPAGGARVALQTGADGDVIRYDCTGRGRQSSEQDMVQRLSVFDDFLCFSYSGAQLLLPPSSFCSFCSCYCRHSLPSGPGSFYYSGPLGLLHNPEGT